MDDDRRRWDDRYSAAAPVEPSPPKGLDPAWLPVAGTALDVACGLGGQSVWLAHRGLRVDALDISPRAVLATRQLAMAHGVDTMVSAATVDLDLGLPDRLRPTYDVVVCQRFRDQRLYGALAERVAPGGLLVVTVLSVVGAPAAGPFHAPAGELRAAFGALDLIVDEEGGGEATIVARARTA